MPRKQDTEITHELVRCDIKVSACKTRGVEAFCDSPQESASLGKVAENMVLDGGGHYRPRSKVETVLASHQSYSTKAKPSFFSLAH